MEKRGLLIGALTAIGVLALVAVLKFFMSAGAFAGRPGPDVRVLGRSWSTVIYEGREGHSDFAVQAEFIAPDGFSGRDLSFEWDMIVQFCEGMAANLSAFVPENVNAADIDHLDLNIVVDNQRGLPFEVTLYLDEGRCVDSVGFAVLDERVSTISRHVKRDEVSSIAHLWGMQAPEITYVQSTSDGRYIRADFNRLSAYERPIETMGALELCVATLALIPEEVDLLVTSVDPSTYPRMEINIFERTGGSIASYTQGLGSADFEIRDGLCIGDQT